MELEYRVLKVREYLHSILIFVQPFFFMFLNNINVIFLLFYQVELEKLELERSAMLQELVVRNVMSYSSVQEGNFVFAI